MEGGSSDRNNILRSRVEDGEVDGVLMEFGCPVKTNKKVVVLWILPVRK